MTISHSVVDDLQIKQYHVQHAIIKAPTDNQTLTVQSSSSIGLIRSLPKTGTRSKLNNTDSKNCRHTSN